MAADDPEVYPIFPDGSVGSMTRSRPVEDPGLQPRSRGGRRRGGHERPEPLWYVLGHHRLKDASGKPLTNDTVIMGLRFNRSGTDPVGLFAVMPPALTAREPTPATRPPMCLRDVVLGWTPGQKAQKHDVYFGTVPADVETAIRSSPLGVLVSQAQDANSYDPAGLLALGQTYYWRVDEVDASSNVTKGNVWSFTVEPVAYPIKNITATASGSSNAQRGPEKTIDGSASMPPISTPWSKPTCGSAAAMIRCGSNMSSTRLQAQ